MTLDEMIKSIESINTQVAQKNTLRNQSIGKRKALEEKFASKVASYKTKYGVDISSREAMSAEIQKVLAEKEKEVNLVSQALSLIDARRYTEAERLLTGTTEAEEEVKRLAKEQARQAEVAKEEAKTERQAVRETVKSIVDGDAVVSTPSIETEINVPTAVTDTATNTVKMADNTETVNTETVNTVFTAPEVVSSQPKSVAPAPTESIPPVPNAVTQQTTTVPPVPASSGIDDDVRKILNDTTPRVSNNEDTAFSVPPVNTVPSVPNIPQPSTPTASAEEFSVPPIPAVPQMPTDMGVSMPTVPNMTSTPQGVGQSPINPAVQSMTNFNAMASADDADTVVNMFNSAIAKSGANVSSVDAFMNSISGASASQTSNNTVAQPTSSGEKPKSFAAIFGGTAFGQGGNQ